MDAGHETALEATPQGSLRVALSGRWVTVDVAAERSRILEGVGKATGRIDCSGRGIADWDSTLLALLRALQAYGDESGLPVVLEDMPAGLTRLLSLASAVAPRRDVPRPSVRTGLLAGVGERVAELVRSAGELLAFLGDSLLSLGRLLRGRAVFRPVDLWLVIQDSGVRALPIVALISALVGMILAFVGAYQLRAFGAEVFIAAGVGLGMVREMAPVMTGILLAGRSGAAFAAEIGTMRVNEEVDAFETMGVSPFDFLVMPRILAMALMMPMLCLYSNLMGILGGAAVGWAMFGIPLAQYFEETWAAVRLTDFGIGVGKALIFGVAVAVAGCLRGLQCGRSAAAVGLAATSAVVTGIVAVIVIDSVAAVMSTVLGI
ncbi:MAG: ABC transporter permease [Candidatus Brocadiaceae bacterium]|nr:ABC transporter permease [Candidatus Brocadiaceae bacterium]